MKRNIFLNKKFLVKWTYNESAFLVQSPFNSNAGIWWAKQWYQPSKKYSGYFATGIDDDVQYQEIIYTDNGIERINWISGSRLFEQFNCVKQNNSLQYLQMTKATKLQIEVLINKKKSFFNNQFLNNNNETSCTLLN